MINFELKQAEIPVDELYEIFQGCAARNSQSEKCTIRSFASTEREEALSILKKRSCIIEKRDKGYRYTEVFLTQTEYDEDGKEINCTIMEIGDLPALDAGKKIRQLRTNLGLTQKQFAAQFDVSIDSVKSWECGRRTPPKWAFQLLMEKLEEIDGAQR